MAVRYRHIRHQGPVLASLGQAAFAAVRQRFAKTPAAPPTLPGPPVTATYAPRPPELVRDYLREVGGDPGAYKGVVPAHMFPQWGFGLAAKTLHGVPYPLIKVLNGGCRLEVHRPLPAGEPLEVRAHLEGIDDDGRRAVLHQVVVTSTKSAPDAVVGHFYGIVPLGGGKKAEGKNGAARKKKERPRVPADAAELAYWRIGPDAGLAFAALTGDFNPVHWVRPYARAFGFPSTILHGFSTMARAIEGLQRSRFAGATDRLSVVDVKFTRPLVLPAKVGLYATGRDFYVGTAPGGPAFLTGTYETKDDPR